MTQSVSSSKALQVTTAGSPNDRLTVTFVPVGYSSGTVYYDSTPSVSSSSNSGSLTPGQSVTLDQETKWFIAAPTSDGSAASAQLSVSPPPNEIRVGGMLIREGASGEPQSSSSPAPSRLFGDIGYAAEIDASQYSNLGSAITNAPVDSTIVLPKGDFPSGASAGSGPIATKRLRIKGWGPEFKSRIVGDASITSGNPVLGFSPGSFDHHIALADFDVDCSSCNTANGIYLNNFDNGRFENVKVRNANVGWDVANASILDFERCDAFNPGRSGYRFNNNGAVGIWLNRCYVYQTSSASRSMFAGYEVLNARDVHWTGSYTLRSPGISYICQYGAFIQLAANSFGGFMFTDAEFDGISDRDGTVFGNCAALYLENAGKVQASTLWLSAASTTSGDTLSPALIIKGGSEFFFDSSCRYNGSEAVALRGAADTVSVDGRVGPNCTYAFDVLSTEAPTNVSWDLDLANSTLTNDFVTLMAAAKRRSRSPMIVETDDATLNQTLTIRNARTGSTNKFRTNSGATGALDLANSLDQVNWTWQQNSIFLTKGGIRVTPTALKTGNYTMATSDCHVPVDATSGNVTITLASAASVSSGRIVHVKRRDSSGNTVTVAAAASQTIDGSASTTLAAKGAIRLISDGTANWDVI